MRISGYRQSWSREPERQSGTHRARHTRCPPEPQTYDAEYTVVISADKQTEQVCAFRAEPEPKIPPWAVAAVYQNAKTFAHNPKGNIIDVFH